MSRASHQKLVHNPVEPVYLVHSWVYETDVPRFLLVLGGFQEVVSVQCVLRFLRTTADLGEPSF